MTFQGMYKVQFQTPLGAGAGVVVLHDGNVQGGDSGMWYAGTYRELPDNGFEAQVHVRRHTQGEASVFGMDDFTLRLSGRGDGNTADLQGVSPQVNGVTMQARLQRLYKP